MIFNIFIENVKSSKTNRTYLSTKLNGLKLDVGYPAPYQMRRVIELGWNKLNLFLSHFSENILTRFKPYHE